MTIKPLGNRVVVKLTKQKQTSAAGIILTTENKNEQAIGEVIAMGPGYGDENVQNIGLSVGDKVMFGKYSGEEITDENDSDTVYKIVNGKDIMAVIS